MYYYNYYNYNCYSYCTQHFNSFEPPNSTGPRSVEPPRASADLRTRPANDGHFTYIVVHLWVQNT